MKKSSVFVTLFLVVALIFAVSCPGNSPALKVTAPTGTEAAVSAVVGTDKTINITLELANDAFVADKVKAGEDLKGWFTLSDGTNIVKANVKSANVATVSPAENTTKEDADKKLVKATIDLVVEPKGATATDTPEKVEIKIPAEKDGVKYTESGKELTATNEIKITITNQSTLTEVSAELKADDITFVEGTADTKKTITVTLTGGTFSKTDGITVKKGSATPTNFDIAYAIGTEDAKKNELTVTLTSKASIAKVDGGDYTLSIPSACITADSTHKPVNISKNFNIVVNQKVGDPTPSSEEVSFKHSEADAIGKTFTITLQNAEFVSDKINSITYEAPNTGDKTHLTFSFEKDSLDAKVLKVTVTATGSVATTDAGDWTITIPKDAVKASEGYVVVDNFKVTKAITVTGGSADLDN